MLDRDVAPGVHPGAETYLNWYLIEDGRELTIVDAGLPASWSSLQDALAELGRTTSDIRALVLTHAHPDHIGFCERARRELDVPIWVHENDVFLTRHPYRYMNERSPLRYALRPGVARVVAAFARAGALRVKAIGAVRRFSDEGALDVPGAPRVVPTPGHTLGHVALHLEDRNAVLAGDAIVTHNPYLDRY